MKRPLGIIGCFVLILFIGSCGKSTCIDPGINVTFSGFANTDLSRVVIEQYTNDTNFSKLISVSVYDTTYVQIQQSNDTIYMPPLDTSGTYIAPGYDYIVAVPGVAYTFFADSIFKITNISYDQVRRKVSGSNGVCTNDTYYYLDTIPYKIPGGSFTDATLPPIDIVLVK